MANVNLAPPGSFVANTILGDHLQADTLREVRARYDVETLSVPGVVRIILPPHVDTQTALREVRARYPRENFGFDLIYQHRQHPALDAGLPEDSKPAQETIGCIGGGCYARKSIAWHDHLATCAAGLGVGIIDTGYDKTHRAFLGRHNIELIVVVGTKEGKAKVIDWHGTSVLSLLAGNPQSSTPGLIPDAAFTMVDIFANNRIGRPETTTGGLLLALWSLSSENRDLKVVPKIINMSLVGPEDDLVHGRITRMAAQGVVFVAAAGNKGPGAPPGYPAAYDEVIAVTAIDEKGLSYDSASHGKYIDVAAPGVRVRAALPGNREGLVTGTSFAAPFVTAIAAVGYRDSPLNFSTWTRRPPGDAKRVMLKKFNKNPTDERDVVYGLGMVKAPLGCGPKAWATRTTPAPMVPDVPRLLETLGSMLWPAKVHPAGG